MLQPAGDSTRYMTKAHRREFLEALLARIGRRKFKGAVRLLKKKWKDTLKLIGMSNHPPRFHTDTADLQGGNNMHWTPLCACAGAHCACAGVKEQQVRQVQAAAAVDDVPDVIAAAHAFALDITSKAPAPQGQDAWQVCVWGGGQGAAWQCGWQ